MMTTTQHNKQQVFTISPLSFNTRRQPSISMQVFSGFAWSKKRSTSMRRKCIICISVMKRAVRARSLRSSLTPASRKGRIGGGQVGITTYAVPTGSLSFWEARLTQFGIAYERMTRFGETYLQFKDPDGLRLEIVEREQGAPSQWAFGGVPRIKRSKASAARSCTARLRQNVGTARERHGSDEK